MLSRPPIMLHTVILLITLACLDLPCNGDSLASIVQRVDKDDIADRVPRTGLAAETGTTLDIKEIVIGRCWDYLRVIGPDSGKPTSQVYCDNTTWPAFANAFAFKDPCNTPDDAYTNFTNLMTVSLPKDGTIFWSGTRDLAMDFARLSNGAMFSLEVTFLGYTVNGLQWCGTPTGSADGINYEECPAFDDPSCRSLTTSVFWGEASLALAKQAQGFVEVLLNGSDSRGAFRNNSFFATVELPNLNTTKVNSVHIIVVHDLDGNEVDTCNTGTILTLKDRITKRGLKWSCVDDPKLATLIQCTQHPDHKKCSLESGRSRAFKLKDSGWNIIILALASLMWPILSC